jgi:hypothetical protein
VALPFRLPSGGQGGVSSFLKSDWSLFVPHIERGGGGDRLLLRNQQASSSRSRWMKERTEVGEEWKEFSCRGENCGAQQFISSCMRIIYFLEEDGGDHSVFICEFELFLRFKFLHSKTTQDCAVF